MYKVEVLHTGEYTFEAKANDCSFTIDAKGKAITPPDTLLASLGSCIGVYIRKYAQGAGIDFRNFKVTVEADFGKESPISFKVISVVIDLQGPILDDRRKKALLEFINNCPIHNTLKSAPRVEIKIR